MHGAPSVSHPVGRSRFAAMFILCAWLLGVAGVALLSLHPRSSGARSLGALGVLVAAGGVAWRSWLQALPGALAWNGEAWSWTNGPRAEPGTPQPVLDLQHVLLLRWSSQGRAHRWFWAERRAQPSSWDDLRRAVYSRVHP